MNVRLKSLVLLLCCIGIVLPAGGFVVLATGVATSPLYVGLVCMVLSAAAVSAVGAVLVGRISGGIDGVLHNVERLHRGDYAVRFAASSSPAGDELDVLTHALDAMLGDFKKALGFAQGVVKGMETPFVVVDTEEHLVMTNPALITILEHTGKPEEYYGQNVAQFFMVMLLGAPYCATALRSTP